MYSKAKKSDSITLTINNTNVNILFGNLEDFNDGIETVNFNEYFDVIVDDKIIAHNSRNGIFIDKHINDVRAFEKRNRLIVFFLENKKEL